MIWLVLGAALGALLLFNGWWNLVRVPPPSRPLDRAGKRFPDGFLWGAGEDPYQHEGSSTNNDWHRWERSEPAPIERGARQEKGTDFWNRWREDFALAKKDGHGGHRIGIEWSRIEPSPGVYDEAAIAKYAEMLRTLKEEHGFVTFVNLWHFTLPLWAADSAGWENPTLMERWEAYVRLCAQRFAPWVDHWSTMIDSQIYALTGYLLGEIPPCVRDPKRSLQVYRTMIFAHARAYRVLKEETAGKASVGQIYFFYDLHRRGFVADVVLNRIFDQIFNVALLRALQTGEINLFLPQTGRVVEKAPEVAGTLDWLGVNYFTRGLTSFSPLAPGFVNPARQTPWITSDMDWEIYPQGIYRTLMDLKRRYPTLPLFITECGIADADDSRRPRFIVDHLAWTLKAIEDGARVLGFFYWSLTDNWEWKRGPWPRFGLYSVDDATGARRETASARLFAAIAKTNALPTELPPALVLEQRWSRIPEDLQPKRKDP